MGRNFDKGNLHAIFDPGRNFWVDAGDNADQRRLAGGAEARTALGRPHQGKWQEGPRPQVESVRGWLLDQPGRFREVI